MCLQVTNESLQFLSVDLSHMSQLTICHLRKQTDVIHCCSCVAGINKQLGLDDQLFVLGDSVVLTVLGQISFLPLLVLAARSCPAVSS